MFCLAVGRVARRPHLDDVHGLLDGTQVERKSKARAEAAAAAAAAVAAREMRLTRPLKRRDAPRSTSVSRVVAQATRATATFCWRNDKKIMSTFNPESPDPRIATYSRLVCDLVGRVVLRFYGLDIG